MPLTTAQKQIALITAIGLSGTVVYVTVEHGHNVYHTVANVECELDAAACPDASTFHVIVDAGPTDANADVAPVDASTPDACVAGGQCSLASCTVSKPNPFTCPIVGGYGPLSGGPFGNCKWTCDVAANQRFWCCP